MKITNQFVTLFVVAAQQGLYASAFAPAFINNNNNVAFKNKNTVALNYRVNESEQFQREKLLTQPPHDLQELKTMANVFQKNAPAAAAPTALELEPTPQPEIGGSRKFDLAGAKKARGPRNTGAVRGAFKSLAGSRSVKSIQGGNCLKTWNIINDNIERVSIMLNNEGVPLSASVEVWQGPKSAPMRLEVASDDGNTYPFSAVLETPNRHNSIAVRNTSPMEFPMGACVVADVEDAKAGGHKQAGQGAVVQCLADNGDAYQVNGDNDVESFQFENTVESIQVLLQTDGRPLHARVELIQGPNDNKQVVDIFSENGAEQPFFAVIDTPSLFEMSGGATVRVINTAPSTVFPLSAIVEPYMVSESYVPPSKPETKVDKSNDLFFLSCDDDNVEQLF